MNFLFSDKSSTPFVGKGKNIKRSNFEVANSPFFRLFFNFFLPSFEWPHFALPPVGDEYCASI